ncbi:MAG TPA: response regulator [Acidimicrobiales bacterium]
MRTDARPGSLAGRLAATRRLLIVEDEPELVRFLRAYFGTSGYEVDDVRPIVTSEAVATAAQRRPDAILVDLGLGLVDGRDVYAALRADPRLAQTPIIVVTADAGAHETLDLDPRDGWVDKPFRVTTLERVIADCLAAIQIDPRVDPLTTGPEHGRFDEMLDIAARSPDGVSLAIVRIPNLDEIQHRLGRAAADFAVRTLSGEIDRVLGGEALISSEPNRDLLVAAIHLDCDGLSAAIEVAHTSLNGAVHLPGGSELTVGIVVGVAEAPTDANDGDALFSAADISLAAAFERPRHLVVAA